MSQWTNEHAILRDLSVVQGRVPIAIEGTVSAGEKPPSLTINEETEEEFFKHCSADADVTAAPDLGMIKKMLDMVRDLNVVSDNEDSLDKVVVISKLNPNSSEFIPKNENTSMPLDKSPREQVKPEKPPRKRKNIALESILQAIAHNKAIDNIEVTPEPMKLVKPNDFMTKINKQNDETIQLTKSVQVEQSENAVDSNNDQSKTTPTEETSTAPLAEKKVNGWFETQTHSPFPKKTSTVILEPTNMFKRKSITANVKKVENNLTRPTSSNSREYQPSMLADEYYKKFAERSKFKEAVKDDIWAKAEKKMKEIDEKRRHEASQSLTSATQTSSTSQASENEKQSFEDTQSTDTYSAIIHKATKIKRCLEIVTLPLHRHQINDECIVCNVMIANRKTPLSCYKLSPYKSTDVGAIQDAEISAVCNQKTENGGSEVTDEETS